MRTRYLVILLSVFLWISCDKKEEKKPDENPTEQVIDSVPKETKKPEPVVPELVFTVQVGAYKNTNTSLANLSDVKVMEESGLYKYRLKSFETYQEAKKFKKSLGPQYQDAFIQALKKGKPIPIKEALE
jgi:cell division protein FtsN